MRLSPVMPFGAWEPDVPPLGSRFATEIINAVPMDGAYGPIAEMEEVSGIGFGSPIGGIYAGIPYVATSNGIYADGTLMVLSANGEWSFDHWGNYVVATDGSSMWYFGQRGTRVTNLPNAPKCSIVKRAKDFLVAANLAGQPSYIQWSAFNNFTDFTPSKSTQADLNDMGIEFGAVMGVAGDEAPYILQERSISRMTYVGPPVIFSFPRLSSHKGCISKGSVIDSPFGTGFFSQDGPNIIEGDSIRQICRGKLEDWFQDNFKAEYAVSAGYDWPSKSIRWTWFNGVEQVGLVYSADEDRAGLMEDGPSLLMNDSEGNLFGVDSTGKTGRMNGANARATLVTGEIQMQPQQRSFVSEIWPVVDAPIKLASAGVRKDLATQDVTYTSDQYANDDGMAPCRSSARAHRFKVVIPRGENWKHAQGVQIGFRPEGRR